MEAAAAAAAGGDAGVGLPLQVASPASSAGVLKAHDVNQPASEGEAMIKDPGMGSMGALTPGGPKEPHNIILILRLPLP